MPKDISLIFTDKRNKTWIEDLLSDVMRQAEICFLQRENQQLKMELRASYEFLSGIVQWYRGLSNDFQLHLNRLKYYI